MKKFFTLSLISIFVSTLFGQNVLLSERLKEAIKDAPDGTYHISMLLKDRVDILDLDLKFRSTKAPQSLRSQRINAALKAKAKTTQAPIIELLENNARVQKIHPLWITNVIYAVVPYEVIDQLKKREDIQQLDLNGKLELEAYEESCEALPPAPDGREIGLERINAHKMWARGYTGRGTIGMSSDQGIDPTHPALPNYIGLYNGDDQGFFSLNVREEFPTFCGDHGIHTLGTMIGLDRMNNDTVGVAFNGSWLGARTICGDDQNENENLASWQWAMDPDGDSSTVADMPITINNSWWDPQARDQCNGVYVGAIQATEAVGMAIIFSAGNSGSGESTITAPKNINYDALNIFCVGNLNGNRADLLISNSSSRGPSICGGDSLFLIKPEVSAPGSSVRSASFDGSFGIKSGTSMASPHVAGSVMLLKEAFPDLLGRDFKEALYLTARDLGDPGEDNTYGNGIIDVDAAFEFLVARGNTPADPGLQVDPVLVDLQVPEFFCGAAATFFATIENQGEDNLETLEMLVEFPELGLQEVLTWTGDMVKGERVSFDSEPLDIPAGIWEMVVTLQNPNGMPDQFLYNNRKVRTVGTLGRAPLEAYVADSDAGLVCQNTQALLRNEFRDSRADNITYEWYGLSNGGPVLATGQTFLTPPLTNDRTYYADILAEYSVGPGSELEADRLSPIQIGGLVFDADIPFTLKSVQVFTDAKGLCEVELLDSEGNSLAVVTSLLNSVGENRMLLNMDVPRGVDFVLKLNSHPLRLSVSGAEYPYTVDGIVSIKGKSIVAGGADAYYYFYDWKIEHSEICGRTPVPVTLDAQMGAPVADFLTSTPAVDINIDPTVEFEDSSTNAEAWFWNFGDGTLSNDQNTSHTYTEVGEYYVSLTVTNANGCTASKVDTIQVLDATSTSTNETIELTGIKVFPNPAYRSLNIETNFDSPEDLNIQLTDLLGRPIEQFRENSVLQSTFQLDISRVTPGIYLLVFNTKEGRSVRKIIKN